jgi:hypothetical protein
MLPLVNAQFGKTRTPELEGVPYAPEPPSRRFHQACQKIKQQIHTLGALLRGQSGESVYRECKQLMSHVDGIARLSERLDADEPWSQSTSRLLLLIVDSARAAAGGENFVELRLTGHMGVEPKQLAKVGCVLHEAVARALQSDAERHRSRFIPRR